MSSRPLTTRHTLRPHPASSAHRVSRLVVDVGRGGRRVALGFQLDIDPAQLRIPAPAPARHTDELWRHTCFEAFVGLPSTDAYLEYNFSPSGAWAAYRFDGYRAGMTPLTAAPPPSVQCNATDRGLELHAIVELEWLDRVPPQSPGALRLGLTAVIEDQAGLLSYWALAHVSEKPDFHRAESFVAVLA